MKQKNIKRVIYYFSFIIIVIILFFCIKNGFSYITLQQRIGEISSYNLEVYNMISYGDPGGVILMS